MSEEKTVQELQVIVGSQQAKIDSLMFEFCPEDMTKEQIAEWEKHQKLSDLTLESIDNRR